MKVQNYQIILICRSCPFCPLAKFYSKSQNVIVLSLLQLSVHVFHSWWQLLPSCTWYFSYLFHTSSNHFFSHNNVYSISSGYEKWSSKLLCSGVSTPQFGVYKIISLVLSFYLENQLTQLKTFFYLLSCSNKIVWWSLGHAIGVWDVYRHALSAKIILLIGSRSTLMMKTKKMNQWWKWRGKKVTVCDCTCAL